jgi:putative restriction endonuclease
MAVGFEFCGERIPLINPQRGIFKPRQITHLLRYQDRLPEKECLGLA